MKPSLGNRRFVYFSHQILNTFIACVKLTQSYNLLTFLSVLVNGIVFNKPFVEKPVDAEDHNIIIYYPASAGGGSQRLFRKIGSRSSVYSPESNVRRTGSFIYEDFMATDGTDVKVETVPAST